jgi:hypothetical protein
MCKLRFLKLLKNKLIGYEFLKRFQGMYALNIICKNFMNFIRFLAYCYKIMKCYNLKLLLFLCIMVCQGNRVVKFSS